MKDDSPLDIPAALWHRRVLILLLAVLTALGATGASFMQPTTYRSSAKVWVKPTAINPPGSIPLALTIDLVTEAQLAKSQQVGSLAADATNTDAASMLAGVQVEAPAAGQVLTIAFVASTPTMAQKGAQSFADAYLTFRADQAQEQIATAIAAAEQQLSGLREKVAALSNDIADADPGSPLFIAKQNELAQTNGQIAIWENNASILNVAAVDAGSVIVSAPLPATPFAPNHTNDAARGFLLGILIGILATVSLESSKRSKQRLAATQSAA